MFSILKPIQKQAFGGSWRRDSPLSKLLIKFIEIDEQSSGEEKAKELRELQVNLKSLSMDAQLLTDGP